MKWPSRFTRTENKAGDTRLFRIFAWLPVYISGVIVWLEFYEWLQKYEITEKEVEINGEKVKFSVGTWSNITKRCR